MSRYANLRDNPLWPPERDVALRQLWPTGLSITLIGATIGVSRNAVAGRRRRLKLPERPSPIRKYAKTANDNALRATEIAA